MNCPVVVVCHVTMSWQVDIRGGDEVIFTYGNKLRFTHCRLFLSDTKSFTLLEPWGTQFSSDIGK